jgi:hypothetical protein
MNIDNIPGFPQQVWSGWVWCIGSNEQSWSKRSTRTECERVVMEVVERLGVEDAFDLFVGDES